MTEAMEKFDFHNLFVLDLANNHQGSVDHGKTIIERCANVVAKHSVRAAVKFQFRDLDTFIHVDHLAGTTNKHVPRFLSTRLSWAQFRSLLDLVKSHKLVSMCTPFDETSIDKIVEMDFDVIKVASCSARDWPLLERVAATGKPIVASTGGLTQDEVDDLVSYLDHRGCDFALMHCVSIYPTPDDACNLANIAAFRERYPGRVIGWSTHENPADMVPVGLAAALGAEMFERHVGIATDAIKLNAYSATPEQVDGWISAWKKTQTLMGSARACRQYRKRKARSTTSGAASSRGGHRRRPPDSARRCLFCFSLCAGRFDERPVAGRYSHDRSTLPRMLRCSKRRLIFRAIRTSRSSRKPFTR